jgi:hypothetical protein
VGAGGGRGGVEDRGGDREFAVFWGKMVGLRLGGEDDGIAYYNRLCVRELVLLSSC